MSRKKGIVLLVVAAGIFFCTALAHLFCIYFGPQCYSAQMAPPQIVESAKAGTMLAPFGAILVSTIFTVLGLYALSGAGLFRRLPLLSFGIYTISIISVIRGLLPIQLYFRHPEKVSDPILIAGIIWLLVGVFFFFGYRAVRKHGVPQSA